MVSRIRIVLLVLVLCLVPLAPGAALAQTPAPDAEQFNIHSPAPGSIVGGLVAVFGTMSLPNVATYSLSFAQSSSATRWIPIGGPQTQTIVDGRLALWDTTSIPDGSYAVRLRAQIEAPGGRITYRDYVVEPVHVSNSPQTPTPYPTAFPSATPTPTLTPTATPTLQPTPALEQGVSPYLYLTMIAQYDPLCPEWQQRFGIWVTNVGTITVTNIVLTNTLPADTNPVLSVSTEGASLAEDGSVTWTIDALTPGQAAKFELQVDVPDWLLAGSWLTHRVGLSSDQVPYLAKSVEFLLGECPWLKATLAALPLPTAEPTATPTLTPSPLPGQALTRPTANVPSPTPVSVSIPEETIDRGLDALTTVITVALVLLGIAMIVMLYRRLGPKQR